jgi:heterotetrameric sarcosine oxidase gamma subunit
MNRYDANVDRIGIGVVAVEASADALARAAGRLGATLPAGARSAGIPQGLLHRSGPESLLVLCDEVDAPALAAELETVVDEASAIVADLTDAHAWIALSGPDTLAVLAQGVAIDLRETTWPPGQAARTLAFGVEAILHRIGQDTFRIGCRASHGEFLLARLRLACDPARKAC